MNNISSGLTEKKENLTSVKMESIIRRYMSTCNTGDAKAIASFFEPDGVHYFPPSMYGGAFEGADAIGQGFANMVKEISSYWTVDSVVIDEERQEAAIEWTHFKTKLNITLRGSELYKFSERGLITEIRAYYASPQDQNLSRLELFGFDYPGRGYPLAPPRGER